MSTVVTKNEQQELDIMPFLHQIWNVFKKIWFLFLLLPLIFAGLNFAWVSRTYSPVYTAESTLSVTAGNGKDTYNNSATASQLGKVFPYILTSSALKDIIAEDLGMPYVPGTISVSNLSNTNFLTIRVTGSDPELAYQVLQSVITNYPQVAQHVVGTTSIEVIDDGGVPQTSGRSAALKNALKKGAVVGLGAAAVALLALLLSFQTVLNSKDLKSITNVTYLGTLPVYKKKKRRRSGTEGISLLKNNVQKDYLEAMRVIRTRLARKLTKKGMVLMVTSTLPGEGKSTVASNLALAFAMQDKKVILIDCDLRNPSVQEVLNFKGNYPGLSEFLKGKCKLADTVASYENKSLKLLVIPGSKLDKEDHPELLRSENMKKLIQNVRKISDLVILDTPPSAMLADAEMVVEYADLAVYVVMCDYARRGYIQKGIRELSETGIELGGVILNAGKESSSGSYGSYGKGSYY